MLTATIIMLDSQEEKEVNLEEFLNLFHNGGCLLHCKKDEGETLDIPDEFKKAIPSGVEGMSEYDLEHLMSPKGEAYFLNQRLALLADYGYEIDEIWEIINKERDYLLSGLYSKPQIDDLRGTGRFAGSYGGCTAMV